MDDRDVTGIGALADPVRRRLYSSVCSRPGAVGRDEAAAAVGVPRHTAKFHLDRLVEDGLLDVEFRRLSGRTGPGAGRPAKLYRRAARDIAVSLPARRYDLAGAILADAVVRAGSGMPLADAVRSAARDAAGRVASEAATSPGTTLTDVLVSRGYEPREGPCGLRLVNCPFHALAQEHTELVCTMNRDFVQGLVDSLGGADVEARLTPTAGECCVTVVSPPGVTPRREGPETAGERRAGQG